LRIFWPPRRGPAQHPWWAVELRPLRRRRRDGAPGGDAIADDRPRRHSSGQGRRNRAAAWRRRRAVVACQHVSGAGAMSGALDWTQGGEAILYQSCAACEAKQYFRRGFCAACGAPDLHEMRASGEGVVSATSLVVRAATPEARAHVPYNIVLV